MPILSRLSALALTLSMAGGSALGAPFTIENLVSHETLGPVAIDPKERWAVVQSTRPWDQAPSYDLADQAYQALSRLTLFDLSRPGAGAPLLDAPNQGVVAGAPSPDGRFLIVHRIVGRSRELGVLRMADRTVRWTGQTTEPSVFGRTAAWIDNQSLVVTVNDPNGPRKRFGRLWQTPEAMTDAWATAARGELSVTALGSGRFANVRPPWPEARLVRIDADTGVVTTLLEGEIVDFELSPDRTQVAVLVEAEIIPQVSTPSPSDTALRRRRLHVVALATGVAISPAPNLDVAPELLAWSPTGAGLLIVARETGEDWAQAKIWRVPMATHRPEVVGAHTRSGDIRARFAAGPPAAWLGEAPIQSVEGVWRAPDGASIGNGRLIGFDHEAVFVQRQDKTYRIDQRGREASVRVAARALQTDPEASGRVLSHPVLLAAQDWAPEGRTAALDWRFSREAMPSGAVRLIAQRGAESRLLMSVNSAWETIPVSAALPIKHLDAKGGALVSWLFLPTDRPASAVKGLIVTPYPGDTAEQSLRKHAREGSYDATDVHVLTGEGYAVVVPSLPFENPAEPAQGFAKALLRAVDAAGEQYEVPTDRLAVWGHSYGGWAALTAGVQSDRFKALVASAPVTNLLAFYGALGPIASTFPQYGYVASVSWFETGRGGMGGPPWSDPMRYVRNSPAMAAPKLKAPALIMVGDLDFTAGEARQMFSLIQRAGGDAVLRTYHGSDHAYISPAQLRDYYASGLAFIAAAFSEQAGARSPAPTPPPPSAAAALP